MPQPETDKCFFCKTNFDIIHDTFSHFVKNNSRSLNKILAYKLNENITGEITEFLYGKSPFIWIQSYQWSRCPYLDGSQFEREYDYESRYIQICTKCFYVSLWKFYSKNLSLPRQILDMKDAYDSQDLPSRGIQMVPRVPRVPRVPINPNALFLGVLKGVYICDEYTQTLDLTTSRNRLGDTYSTIYEHDYKHDNGLE